MAKKKRRRSRKFTLPLAPVIGLAAGLAPSAIVLMQGDWNRAVDYAAYNYLGIAGLGTPGGPLSFNPEGLKNGLLPLVLGALIHKFVGGPPLNINRMLAAANVPIIRI